MSSTLKYKPNLQAQMNEHEVPEWKGKWANSYGRILGFGRYDSAAAARVAYLESLPGAITKKGWKRTDGSSYPAQGFVIQIPVSV